MSTLSRRLSRGLAPHARTAWLVLLAVVVAGTAAGVLAVLALGGDRVGVVMTVFAGVVAFGVLAAVLDGILVASPYALAVGSRPTRRGPWLATGHVAGRGVGFDVGGSDSGGSGGDCGSGGCS